jgi:MFS family permease
MGLLRKLLEIIEHRLEFDRWYSAYALANLSAGGVSILIPLYVLHLGGGVGEIGLLTAVGNLIAVPASIAWGSLSDRWNSRKVFVVIGLFGIAFSFLSMGFIKSLPLLLLLNAAYMLFWMSSASVVTILIIEKEDRGRWDDKIGSFNLNSGLGWALGLAAGLAWTSLAPAIVTEALTFRYLFIFMGISSLLGGAIAYRVIPSDIKFDRSKFRGRLLEAGDMITERFRYLPIHLYYLVNPRKFLSVSDRFGPNLTAFIVAVGLVFTGFSTFFIPLPAYFKTVIGLNDGTIYLLFIANSLSSALFYRRAARLIKRVGPLRVLRSSLALRVVLLPSLVVPFIFINAALVKLIVVSLFFVLIGVSWALISVGNLVITSRLSPSSIKGQVFGVYNGISGLSAVFGSLIGGYVAKSGSYLMTFLLASLFVSLGLVIIRQKVNEEVLR